MDKNLREKYNNVVKYLNDGTVNSLQKAIDRYNSTHTSLTNEEKIDIIDIFLDCKGFGEKSVSLSKIFNLVCKERFQKFYENIDDFDLSEIKLFLFENLQDIERFML